MLTMKVGNYVITDKVLGGGLDGNVYWGYECRTRIGMAVKVLDKKNCSQETKDRFKKELEVETLLQNEPGVCKLLDTVQAENKEYAVMEYLDGGSLFDFVFKEGLIPEHTVLELMEQIIKTVKGMHLQGVVHHDLKLENIMLKKCPEGKLIAKLIDFGLSVKVEPFKNEDDDDDDEESVWSKKGGKTNNYLTLFCGTMCYSPPEILEHQPYDGFALDVYSLGVILFVMLTGKFPFNGDDGNERYKQQSSSLFLSELNQYYPQGTSSDMKYLVLRMLDPNPQTRIKIDEVLKIKMFEPLQKLHAGH